MRLLIIILLQTSTCLMSGQVRLITFNCDSGVHLRWIGNTDPNVSGWHVERANDDGPFQRITGSPLTRVMDFSEMTRQVGRYKAAYFLALWGVNEERDLTFVDVSKVLNSGDRNMHFALLAAEPTLSTLNGEYYFDSTITASSNVRYRLISVVGPYSNEVASSSPIVIENHDEVPIPSQIGVVGGDASVMLTWSRDPDFELHGQVVGSRIWRSPSDQGPFEEITLQTAVPFVFEGTDTTMYSYTDNNVQNGEQWYYFVQHVHATGVTSARSDIVRVVVGQDATPPTSMNFKVESLAHAAELSWSWGNGSTTPSFLELWRMPSHADTPRIVQILATTDTSFIDAFIPMGEGVRYVLASIGSSDTVFSEVVSHLQPDVLAPSPPRAVQAEADTGKIRLHWTRSVDSDVVGYRLYRSTSLTPTVRLQVNNRLISDTAFTDTIARDAESTYMYYIESEDRAGLVSKPSAPILARVLDITPPSTPQFTRFDRKDRSVVMEWSTSRSPDVRHYEIETSIQDEAWNSIGRSATSGPFTDTLIDAGVHHYRVIAVDSAGNRSKPSQTRSTTIVTELNAPRDVTVVRDTFAIRLNWRAVSGAEGYRIERVDPRTRDRTDCVHLGPDALSWADRVSKRDVPWTYEISARDAAWRFGKKASVTYDPGAK